VLALYEPIGALYFQGSASTGYSGLRKEPTRRCWPAPRRCPHIPTARRVVGDLALTSTVLPLENPVLPGAIISEVARRQPDGTWLWGIDEGEGGLPTAVGGFEVGGWDATAASNNRRWLN